MKSDADKPSLDLKNIEFRVKDHWKNQNISKINHTKHLLV